MRFHAMCIAAALALPAFATDSEHKGSQQSKFATCAHESKGLRGEEHQKFMSECLKGRDTDASARKETAHKDATHRAADESGPQQNRMKTCNEEAARRDLHGDERRSFMSSCLKGH